MTKEAVLDKKITVTGTTHWVFDNLSSYFDYEIGTDKEIYYDVAISLIWYICDAFDDNGCEGHIFYMRLPGEPGRAASISVRQWMDVLASDLKVYANRGVYRSLHALWKCLYAYLDDIDALDLVHDVKLS